MRKLRMSKNIITAVTVGALGLIGVVTDRVNSYNSKADSMCYTLVKDNFSGVSSVQKGPVMELIVYSSKARKDGCEITINFDQYVRDPSNLDLELSHVTGKFVGSVGSPWDLEKATVYSGGTTLKLDGSSTEARQKYNRLLAEGARRRNTEIKSAYTALNSNLQ